jgi:hypothetical protein
MHARLSRERESEQSAFEDPIARRGGGTRLGSYRPWAPSAGGVPAREIGLVSGKIFTFRFRPKRGGAPRV